MRRLVLVPIVALLLVACGRGGELPQLPLSAGNAGKASAMSADAAMPYRRVRYELADGVKADKATQDTFRFDAATREDVTRIAKVFGITGEIRAEDNGWRIGATTEDPERKYSLDLEVGKAGEFAVNSPYGVSSGIACVQPDRPVASDGPATDSACSASTTTTSDPRLPSDDAATSKARRLLTDAGADVTHTRVRVERYGDNVAVHLQPTIAGETIDGLEYHVTFGRDSLVADAQANLGVPKKVGAYDLATLTRAVERLNQQPEIMPAIAQDIAEPQSTDPIVVKLTAVRVGLMFTYDGGDHSIWLTPAYVFTTDQDNGEVTTAAAADKYFPTTTTSPTGDTKPPATGSGGGSTGDPGSIEPAPPVSTMTTP